MDRQLSSTPAMWISHGSLGPQVGDGVNPVAFTLLTCAKPVFQPLSVGLPGILFPLQTPTTVANSDGYIVGFLYETLTSTLRADSKQLSVSLFRLGFHWVNVKNMLALELLHNRTCIH